MANASPESTRPSGSTKLRDAANNVVRSHTASPPQSPSERGRHEAKGTDEHRETPSLKRAIKRRKLTHIYVGLDFGTSCTKVAFREMGGVTKVTPLLFDHGLSCYPAYCLPNAATVDMHGRLLCGVAAGRTLESTAWSSGIRRIKVLVAGAHDESFRDDAAESQFREYLHTLGLAPEVYSPDALAAVMLARQMQSVRTSLESRYQGSEIDIRFNVCIPIEQIQNSAVLSAYTRINNVAQVLVRDWGADDWSNNSLLEVAAAFIENASALEDVNGRLFSVPESVAQVTSYLSSLQSAAGIHAVVDIGSGTTDISIFNLMGPHSKQSRTYWYSARNIPLGTGGIEHKLAMMTHLAHPGPLTEGALQLLLQEAKDDADIGEIVWSELLRIERRCRYAWAEAYGRFRKQSAWSNIPLFLCGGGSRIHGVREVFARSWVPRWPRHSVRKMPTPSDFDTLGTAVPFYRMSVAYGLTYPKPQLVEYVLPNESPDHTPVLNYRPVVPDWNDQMYPNSRWV